MSGGHAKRIEVGLDVGASALFASAIAFAAKAASLTFAAGGAGVAFLGCFAILRRVLIEDRAFRLADFAVDLPSPEQPEELVLTDPDRFIPGPADAGAGDELMLDDVLASLGDDSRVVRLFDPSAMPTPGQLKARIDRHLNEAHAPNSDASQALQDALAELRQSLR